MKIGAGHMAYDRYGWFPPGFWKIKVHMLSFLFGKKKPSNPVYQDDYVEKMAGAVSRVIRVELEGSKWAIADLPRFTFTLGYVSGIACGIIEARGIPPSEMARYLQRMFAVIFPDRPDHFGSLMKLMKADSKDYTEGMLEGRNNYFACVGNGFKPTGRLLEVLKDN